MQIQFPNFSSHSAGSKGRVPPQGVKVISENKTCSLTEYKSILTNGLSIEEANFFATDFISEKFDGKLISYPNDS